MTPAAPLLTIDPGDIAVVETQDALTKSEGGSPDAQAPADPTPWLGRVLGDRYRLIEVIGTGGFGFVFRAKHLVLGRDVAVKILHRELSANAQLVSRFTREAKVASRLQHPNVVQVLLAGQLPDRALYMAMEYLDGMSLQSALAAAGGALPLPRALHIVLQLCEAVGEAHAHVRRTARRFSGFCVGEGAWRAAPAPSRGDTSDASAHFGRAHGTRFCRVHGPCAGLGLRSRRRVRVARPRRSAVRPRGWAFSAPFAFRYWRLREVAVRLESGCSRANW